MPRVKGPGSDVHLTPPEIWERVSKLSVDQDRYVFDPCPHPWTIDGLEDDWPLEMRDTAYVNPPFSDLDNWAYTVTHNYLRTKANIMTLVPVRTSQPYWPELCHTARAIAFWRGNKERGGLLGRRVRFLDKDGIQQAGAPFDTAIFLATPYTAVVRRFAEVFSDVCTIVYVQRSVLDVE